MWSVPKSPHPKQRDGYWQNTQKNRAHLKGRQTGPPEDSPHIQPLLNRDHSVCSRVSECLSASHSLRGTGDVILNLALVMCPTPELASPYLINTSKETSID
ncbi:hypothetical protein TNCV_2280731 [Trichonephila clavipes]|nr:hypothetical protein TNCV_2280731 [Trichonephila clavipes]